MTFAIAIHSHGHGGSNTWLGLLLEVGLLVAIFFLIIGSLARHLTWFFSWLLYRSVYCLAGETSDGLRCFHCGLSPISSLPFFGQRRTSSLMSQGAASR